MYKLCIFDLDGTLLDTAKGIISSANFSAEKLGIQPLAENILYTAIGTPIFDIYRQYYHLDENTAAEAVKQFRLAYAEHGMHIGRVYVGISELLSKLKKSGCLLAVATMKPKETAETMLKEFELRGFFDDVIGKGDNPSVTKAQMIKSCMRKFSLDSSKTIMIGDSKQDMDGAAEAGVAFIGVAYGYGFKDSGVKNVSELMDLLCPKVNRNTL